MTKSRELGSPEVKNSHNLSLDRFSASILPVPVVLVVVSSPLVVASVVVVMSSASTIVPASVVRPVSVLVVVASSVVVVTSVIVVMTSAASEAIVIVSAGTKLGGRRRSEAKGGCGGLLGSEKVSLLRGH